MATSPIAKLNLDILWSIFSLTSDMDDPLEYDASTGESLLEYSAFDTALRASQVCQSWRNLFLESPSLWGNVIRLDLLAHWKEEGRKEIIGRTGESLLCFKGSIDDLPSQTLVTEWLPSLWQRIRKIDVRIDVRPSESGFYDLFREVLTRPSPNLKSFKVFSTFYGQLVPKNEGQYLFGNTAPSLQELHTYFMGYNINAPWKSQLRSLSLISADHEAEDVLEAIRCMPLLEYLDVGLYDPPLPLPMFPAKQSIKLPWLAYLRLPHNFMIGLVFAHAIKPSDTCVLFWKESALRRDTIDSEEYVYLVDVLSRYAQMYFAIRDIKFLKVHSNPVHIEILGSPNDPADSKSETQSALDIFHVSAPLRFPEGTSSFEFIRYSLSSCDLTSITNLDLSVDDTFSPLVKWSQVSAFFHTLPSVVDLVISYRGMDIIQLCPEGELVYSNLRPWISVSDVHSFLVSRRRLGYPVLVLCLKRCKGDWSILESMDGLKVTWEVDHNKFTYTCGTGSPEKLDFRDKS